MRIRRVILVAIIVMTVLLVAERTALKVSRLNETLTARAHRICRGCGLTDEEIDVLIDTMRGSVLTREQEVELWASTYQDAGRLAQARKECRSCVQAILDVSEEKE